MSLRSSLRAAALLGAAALAFGAFAAPEKLWAAVLLAGFYPLTLSLGAAVFLAIGHVTGATWFEGLRAVPRAMTRCYWPAAAVVMLALVCGHHGFYGWIHAASAHEGVPASQQAWLAPSFLLLRAAAYLLVWGALIRTLRGTASAAAFLVVFGVTISLASFDWFMALEPGWGSTIFGVYIFAGLFLSTLAAIAVLTVALGKGTDAGLHDLGKLIFGFSVFWAYIWYCQYMLIWYTNNPEETSFYRLRHAGGWAVLSLTSVVLNWIAPFLILLPQWTKRRPEVLLRVGLVILVGHWLDLYIVAMPRFARPGTSFGLWEGCVFLGSMAVFSTLFLREVEPREGQPQNFS